MSPFAPSVARPQDERSRRAKPVPLRRARVALGTLVELGVQGAPRPAAALEAAWAALAGVERALSAFDPRSDVARFNAAPAGAVLAVGPHAAQVLRAAAVLHRESGGLFDVTLGTGPDAWTLEAAPRGTHLVKRSARVRLDLGGIAKGYAVDRMFEVLSAALGPGAGLWVNAGGDLRVHGVTLPVHLRDERGGGARPWMLLEEGALATSHLAPGARSQLSGAEAPAAPVSVAAPSCLWADALTKVVAATHDPEHPLLAAHGACAWVHAHH